LTTRRWIPWFWPCRYPEKERSLQQYAGRLHREHDGKQNVRILDYVEPDQPQLARMWDKRQRGYRAMGYEIIENPASAG
jgi:superfamily II DNA or RNA helicase